MKSITVLLFGNVQNDSRVKRTIKALKDYNVNLLCRDYDTQVVCNNAYFYHNRYGKQDHSKFEPHSSFIIKFFKKLKYYIDTEKIKSKNAPAAKK